MAVRLCADAIVNRLTPFARASSTLYIFFSLRTYIYIHKPGEASIRDT